MNQNTPSSIGDMYPADMPTSYRHPRRILDNDPYNLGSGIGDKALMIGVIAAVEVVNAGVRVVSAGRNLGAQALAAINARRQ